MWQKFLAICQISIGVDSHALSEICTFCRSFMSGMNIVRMICWFFLRSEIWHTFTWAKAVTLFLQYMLLPFYSNCLLMDDLLGIAMVAVIVDSLYLWFFVVLVLVFYHGLRRAWHQRISNQSWTLKQYSIKVIMGMLGMVFVFFSSLVTCSK